jgi:hypothetical protein
MISSTLTEVDDEETLSALLDSLERYHGVKALYQKPCLTRTYHVVIEGPNEGRFESDLNALASQAGWSVKTSNSGTTVASRSLPTLNNAPA